MKKLYFLFVLSCLAFAASAQNYFPVTVNAPYSGAAQSVCVGSTNTATSVNYTVCGTSSTGSGLAVTPNWYLNGTLVFTGAPFISTTPGGTIPLPAGSFTYNTAGSYTGTNGLECILTWGPTAPGTCAVTTSVTGTPTNITVVNPPVAITGPTSTCATPSVSITLSDASGGGFWSSSNTAIANVGSSTGVVTGTGTGGTVVITYSNSCATVATTTITTIASPGAITASGIVLCIGSSLTLSDAVGGGTWSSSNTAIATIISTTGVITGATAGSVTITYSTGCGADIHVSRNVRTTPTAISGPSVVCSGSTITLSDGSASGTWSSSNSSIAAVGSISGIVTGGSVAGTTTITYSTGCGSNATTSVTAIGIPGAISGGTVPFCSGTVAALSDATAGGTWSSDNTAVATVDINTGAVSGTGTTGGTADITYSTGCGTGAITTVTVTAAPGPITGALRVCEGLNIVLHNVATGGVWSSNNTTLATINPGSGVITAGTVPGVVTITYSTGCGTDATRTVTVYAQPDPTISGSAFSICSGAFASLSDITSGGTWSSDDNTIATVNSTSGAVTGGINGGVANITYSTGCGSDAYTTMTVTAIPGPIAGPTTICSPGTITLSDIALGGTWSSSNTSTATVDINSGVVTAAGSVGGTTVISYATGCGATATSTVTIVSTPGAISASASSICSGATATLSDAAAGGTWSSSNTSIATVNIHTGAVTGGTIGGTAIISYFTGCGSAVTTSITVTAAPGPITGTTSICSPSGTTTLSDVATGGTWTSSITTTATIGSSSGVVTAAGAVGSTTTITYSTGCGTDATTTVIVVTTPGTISASSSTICSGSGATLSDAIAGGTWSSNNTSIATVDVNTGAVTGGVTGGIATIIYSTGCGTAATTSITVTAAPSTILGTLSVCAGSGTTLSDAIGGGTWSSSTTVLAIGSISGAVTSTTVGTTTITYSTGCGTAATATFTVLGVAGAISPGASTICSGAGITLSDAVTGGVWSTSSTAIATVGSSSGIVTGGTVAGNATITYSTGCSSAATTTITVHIAPGAILPGASTICSASVLTLSDAVTGGIWTTSSTSIATVGSSSGTVTGGTIGGTATITYSTGCGANVTTSITVTAAPSSTISGALTVCPGSATTLSNAIAGGTWSSSSTSIATVGTSSGTVTGGIAGTTTITYSTGCGTNATTTFTVTATPGAISAPVTICAGGTVTLTDAVAGGVWSSSNTSIATIGSSSGFVTGGVTGGTATISYSTGCGSAATTSVTITAAPVAISGLSSVCSGLSATLSDAITGGTWSSSSTVVATIGLSSGTATGGIAGTTLITYSTGCGTNMTKTFTVIATPTAITGASTVCSGSGTTLSDAVTGGAWSSSSTSVATVGSGTGFVTGGTAGPVTISYSTGCGAPANKTFTVLATPTGISASATSVCSGASATLSDAVVGGTWTSSNTSIATVIAGTGAVTGAVTGGTVTITYSTGCNAPATQTFTVVANPGPITGASTVCTTLGTTLSDAITGGIWSSSNTTVATIGSTSGTITGSSGGTAIISYSTGCGSPATHTFTVLTTPGSISASATTVCSGLTATLSDGSPGGTWTSSNTSIATVIAGTGAFTGAVTGGTVTITYSTGCNAPATQTFTVVANPGPITGASTVCATLGTTLSDAITGGIWSSSNSSVATIGSTSGAITGSSGGTAIISYSTGCGTPATHTFTVLITPGSIAASATTICSGSPETLSDGSPGGTWTSSNTSIATVISGSGVLTGAVTGGTVTISYSTGCNAPATKSFTVIAVPTIITGPSTVCAGFGTTLSDAITGGIWSSSSTTVATIGTSSGAITGTSGGTAIISYSTGCGSPATHTFTVLTTPTTISASTSAICSGSPAILSDGSPGGTWTSDNTSVATVVAGTGVVTGGPVGGVATITYSTGCGADATTSITVTSLPGTITGPSSVCFSSSITLSDVSTDGTWSSDNTNIATVDAAGNVNGIIPGTAVISYSTSCAASSATITVLDSPAPISGALFVCAGISTSLSDITSGGAWSTDNTSVATVDVTGLVTGGISGTANITYSTGCGTDAVATFTVNPQPLTPAVIAVPTAACTGSITALSDAVSGGVWGTDNTLIATIDASGNIYGVTPGIVTVSYTIANSCGSRTATTSMTIEAPPTPAIITGPTAVCQGAVITLSDVTIGGVWSSDNTAAQVGASGVVLGQAGGTATISYTISNSCGPVAATQLITINPLPAPAAITGYTTSFCAGTTLQLSDATAGGVWSSNITTVATISNTGLVRGLFGGSTTIYYSVTNGCGTVPALLIITIDPLASIGVITGGTNVCIGSQIPLSDTTAGGVWSSSVPSIAAIGSTGVATGISTGTTIISYVVSNVCGTNAATISLTVNTVPVTGIITGADSVCVGHVIALSDTIAGGVWSSDFPSTAIVNAAGSVYGVATGTDVIRYTFTNSCGTRDAIMNIVIMAASSGYCQPAAVNAVPASIATELKAYPNPNTGTFTMNLVSGTDEPVQVIITNIVGEKVREFTTATNKDNVVSINTAGIYFVSTITAHGNNMVKVIVGN